MRLETDQIKRPTVIVTVALAILISSTAGLAWQPSLLPLTFDSGFDYGPEIARTSDGNTWLFWSSNRQGSFNIFAKFNDGVRWSSDRNIMPTTRNDNRPSLVELANGTYFLVWESQGNWDGSLTSEIVYGISTDRGGSWSSPVRLTFNTVDDRDPDAVLTSDGRIFIFWSSKRTGNDEIFYKIIDGTNVSEDIPVTSDPASDFSPAAVETIPGQILLVWASQRTGNSDLFYRFYAGSWSQELQLTYDLNQDSFPALTVARDGTVWLVWSTDRVSPDPPQDDLFFSKSHDQGQTWSTDLPLTRDLSPDFAPSLVQTGTGRITVAYVSDRGGNFDIWPGTMLVTDVAALSLTQDKTSVSIGELVTLTVTVENQGWKDESPQLSLLANGTLVSSQSLTILPGESGQAVFVWNTFGKSSGCYYMAGTMTPLPEEDDTTDNSVGGLVRVLYQGDANRDGSVNILDLVLVGSSFGTRIGDPNYRSEADINKDGVINILDLVIVGGNFGKKLPC